MGCDLVMQNAVRWYGQRKLVRVTSRELARVMDTASLARGSLQKELVDGLPSQIR